MKVGKSLSGIVVGALAASAVALTASPASAAQPFDPTFTPVAADLVGVGSDTSEVAMHYAATGFSGIPGFNEGKSTGRIASYQAGGGGQVTLPGGQVIDRPNGSTAGKSRLYGANNAPEVDFARSSSSLSTAEVGAGLQAFPFAVDGLKLAVSNTVASNAPATISPADMVKIYDGTYTNWSQVPGGKAGVIKPLIPQSGSGTRSFFTSQLTAANGGVAVTLAGTVTEVQEHDPAPIASDPNAVAPFSTGRAKGAGSAIKLAGGFAAQRALYNVVRGTDLGRADLQSVFGPSGFLCSDSARALIEAAGFFQLARADKGGVCGEATQSATTDFDTNALPYDPTFAPVSGDLVGVGSDTSEIAMHNIADGVGSDAGFNAGKSTGRIASYQAGGGGKVVLPGGQVIDRPNGSTAGKSRLYGANNAPEVDFARSSSSLSTAEVGAGLQAFPFAVDGLKLAVSNTVASNAPATISPADMVKIYDGTYTNWSQVPGGKAGVIKPLIPQSGSGTRSFFTSQLTAANGGVAVTLAGTVTEVQEHDPAPIASDPNAVAPFSTGRAKAAGPGIKLAGGFEAQRALYNVVRGTDLSRNDLQAAFGPNGFVCSDDATPLIEAAGFFQLARDEDGGVCGEATQAATSDFDVNDSTSEVATTTALSATSPAAGRVTLVATVAADGASPSGTVTFTEGSTVVAADVAIVSGRATANLTGVAAGSKSYTATYTPAEGTQFTESSGTATVTVKAASTTEATAKAVKKGKKGKVKVTVTASGGSASGTVTLLKGSNEVDEASLSGGAATLKTGKVTKKTTFTVVYGGSNTVDGSQTKVTVKIKATKKK